MRVVDVDDGRVGLGEQQVAEDSAAAGRGGHAHQIRLGRLRADVGDGDVRRIDRLDDGDMNDALRRNEWMEVFFSCVSDCDSRSSLGFRYLTGPRSPVTASSCALSGVTS